MCKCKNIEVGTYDNQVELSRPLHMVGRKDEGSESDIICVDSCLKDEIIFLWSKGVKTTGCCCGHNYLPPYIGVSDDSIDLMVSLNYETQPNELHPNRLDGFKPKTV